MALAGGCAADGAGGSPARAACTAEGTALLVPKLDSAQACTRFSAALTQALTRHGAAPDAGKALTITLRIARPGIATALIERAGPAPLKFDTNIAQSDRALGPEILDRLADDVARQLAGR